MKHKTTPRFWECYQKLPEEVQKQADQCFERLKSNPKHLSLHLKKVGRFWSARIGMSYRALAVEQDECLIWFWIDTHSEYDRLLGRE